MPNDGTNGEGAPKCTIVIPVFNCAELTAQCLAAIRQNTAYRPYEVVIVDNGSTDNTPRLLDDLGPPFSIIRNDGNLGFARACNQGANASSAEYVLFLNNDTVPLAGWLRPMIQRLEARPEVGIVGAKLVYPGVDLIQHAGVSATEDGVFHVYQYLPASLPEANVERECEAVTGACMIVRKALFDRLGGFDESFVNGFEDVDFCLKARELGQKVLYCPESVLYHHESMTQGRMAHNDANYDLYRSRWSEKLSPADGSVKRALAMMGSPLLKINALGSRFVMFYGRTFFRCDRRPPEIRTYRSTIRYYAARLYYSLRYIRYRGTIRQLTEQARRAGPDGSGETPEGVAQRNEVAKPKGPTQ